MDNQSWGIERWRIVLVLFLAALGGLLTDFWLISLLVSLLGYIGWLLFKLYQLNNWLEKGAKSHNFLDSNGVWERLTHRIQGIRKKSNTRKRRMSKLLKRMQGIITGLPYATIVLNGENEIDWANTAAHEYLNIDIKKDRGQRIDNLIRLPEIANILEFSAGSDFIRNIEITLPHNNQRQLNIQLIPVQKDLKLLIARDVSERVNTLKMRKNFIANASHELRTPLTVVLGYLEILQSDDRLPDDLQTAIRSATEQSTRMQQIIEDLLILSRLENTVLSEENSEVIDIPSLLKSIVNEESILIQNNSHTLNTEIDDSLLIKGSEAEIISVCVNLIHNSVKHTQTGTTITIKWAKNKIGEACLSVIDDGQGIPAEHLAHLTERFYRVDKGRSRDKGGTGLGLAIVLHIIQRHDGHLDIQSTRGKGTNFTACFPVNRIVGNLS